MVLPRVQGQAVKPFIVHFVERHGDAFADIEYVDTFRQLRLKYDAFQVHRPPTSFCSRHLVACASEQCALARVPYSCVAFHTVSDSMLDVGNKPCSASTS